MVLRGTSALTLSGFPRQAEFDDFPTLIGGSYLRVKIFRNVKLDNLCHGATSRGQSSYSIEHTRQEKVAGIISCPGGRAAISWSPCEGNH